MTMSGCFCKVRTISNPLYCKGERERGSKEVVIVREVVLLELRSWGARWYERLHARWVAAVACVLIVLFSQ